MSRYTLNSFVTSSVALVTAAYAVCLNFMPTGSEDANVRLWSGNVSMSMDDYTGTNKTYYAVGTLGQLGTVSETNEIAAQGLEMQLSGIPSEYLSLVLSNNYRGRKAALYLLLYNEDRSVVQKTTIFSGRMEQILINEGAETSVITVKCESRLIDLNRPREKRYTQEFQQSLYPNDTGLEFIAGMADRTFYWGSTGPVSSIGNSIGGEANDGNSQLN